MFTCWEHGCGIAHVALDVQKAPKTYVRLQNCDLNQVLLLVFFFGIFLPLRTKERFVLVIFESSVSTITPGA